MPYLDGLPPAISVSGDDLIAINQGGTPGIPGSGTTRAATVQQVTSGPFPPPPLPTSDADLLPGQYWNNQGFVCVKL